MAAFCLLLRAPAGRSLSERLIAAAVAWGLLVVALTEVLSLWGGLTRLNLALGWSLLAVVLAAFSIRELGWPAVPRAAALCQGSPRQRWPLAALLAAVVLPTLLIALLSLPNNDDALTYHVARVDHWIQNRTVAFYPAQSTRGNEFPPFAEFVILQFQLLSAGDAFSGLEQWLALLGSLVLVHSIARPLGAGPAGAVLAVVFAGTLPMAVLQASSTQNDLVAAFWVLGFVERSLAWRETRRFTDFVIAAGSLGLGAFTKGTVLIFALPFSIWLLSDLLRRPRPSIVSMLGLLTAAAAILLLPNMPHALRNLEAYGVALGGPSAAEAAVGRMSPRRFAANLLRDGAMQFATPSDALNARIVAGTIRIAAALTVDLQDPDSTFLDTRFGLMRNVTFEDIGTAPLHALLLLGAVAAVLLSRQRRPVDRAYALCALGGFLLFISLVRWQPWMNRLMLPGYLAAAPFVGEALGRCPAWVRNAAMVLLLLGALPFAYAKFGNPLVWDFYGRPTIWQIPRRSTMFEHRPELEAQYRSVAFFLKRRGCDQVGILRDVDLWTAPMFRLMAAEGFSSFRIENMERLRPDPDPGPEATLDVPDLRPPAPLGPFHPKAIVWMGANNPRALAFGGVEFVRSFDTANLHVYLPRPPS